MCRQRATFGIDRHTGTDQSGGEHRIGYLRE
jgi:hypothetical protein